MSSDVELGEVVEEKTFDDVWRGFESGPLRSATLMERQIAKRIFYAGALGLYTLILDQGHGRKGDDLETFLLGLEAELQDFVEDFMVGGA